MQMLTSAAGIGTVSQHHLGSGRLGSGRLGSGRLGPHQTYIQGGERSRRTTFAADGYW